MVEDPAIHPQLRLRHFSLAHLGRVLSNILGQWYHHPELFPIPHAHARLPIFLLLSLSTCTEDLQARLPTLSPMTTLASIKAGTVPPDQRVWACLLRLLSLVNKVVANTYQCHRDQP